MTPQAPAFAMIVSNGARYSSRSARSLTLDADGEALGLEVVGHEVLDRRRDALVLHAGHVTGADLAG